MALFKTTEVKLEQQHKDISYTLGEEEKERYNELKTKYLDDEKKK